MLTITASSIQFAESQTWVTLRKTFYWFAGGSNWISVSGWVDSSIKVQIRGCRGLAQKGKREREGNKIEGYYRQVLPARSYSVPCCLWVNAVSGCENDSSLSILVSHHQWRKDSDQILICTPAWVDKAYITQQAEGSNVLKTSGTSYSLTFLVRQSSL